VSLLQLHAVVSGYQRDRPVIRGVDLELETGDFFGLIGPNGCGKSTLLRTVTGVLAAAEGRVELAGRDVAEMTAKERARAVAVVPQTEGAGFAFSVRETVAMGRHPHLRWYQTLGGEDQRVIDAVLELTGTADLANRNIGELSGGERQRAIIARALAQQPQILLLDEPTNHLDINHQVEVFDLLHELNQERGIAILCVTHDLNFAAEYCTGLLLMQEGRMQMRGRPSEVLTAEIIRTVYGIEVDIDAPGGGRGVRISPVSRKSRQARDEKV